MSRHHGRSRDDPISNLAPNLHALHFTTHAWIMRSMLDVRNGSFCDFGGQTKAGLGQAAYDRTFLTSARCGFQYIIFKTAQGS